jgi:hypothetical protein
MSLFRGFSAFFQVFSSFFWVLSSFDFFLFRVHLRVKNKTRTQTQFCAGQIWVLVTVAKIQLNLHPSDAKTTGYLKSEPELPSLLTHEARFPNRHVSLESGSICKRERWWSAGVRQAWPTESPCRRREEQWLTRRIGGGGRRLFVGPNYQPLDDHAISFLRCLAVNNAIFRAIIRAFITKILKRILCIILKQSLMMTIFYKILLNDYRDGSYFTYYGPILIFYIIVNILFFNNMIYGLDC